jgi:serine phosphatase RsbU (regulator of sigma subunit)
MRYTGRAFASQGEGPASVLSKLNDLTDVDVAGHFATAVCVVFDPGAGTATAASAGHPRPLLIDGDRVDFVPTTPGQPIGLGRGATYESVTVALPAAGTLLLFTDGLFERRAEGIDVGLERLRQSVGDAGGDLSDLLDGVLTAMGCGDEGGDDVAILGARWGN